ncbi:MAG: PEGA domain-containing protein, partial [Myxococcota bacterium]
MVGRYFLPPRLCLERLDRTRDAILSYRRFLELDPDAREKGRVLADIERLEAKLKASERGRLKVTTSPVGAAITVRSDQGKPTSLGMSPVEIALPSGDYTLTIEHKGYETRERRVTLRGGEQTQFHVDLESVVEIATRVVVETEPREATVRLGGPTGRVLAKKTPAEVKLKPGKGMLHISAPGYRARKASYTLREGETLRLS